MAPWSAPMRAPPRACPARCTTTRPTTLHSGRCFREPGDLYQPASSKGKARIKRWLNNRGLQPLAPANPVPHEPARPHAPTGPPMDGAARTPSRLLDKIPLKYREPSIFDAPSLSGSFLKANCRGGVQSRPPFSLRTALLQPAKYREIPYWAARLGASRPTSFQRPLATPSRAVAPR